MKTAIIGCGFICQQHLRALRRLQCTEVTAVCDANRDAAAVIAERYGIRAVFDDAASMLDQQDADVVHVLTPPSSHRALAELALKHGTHVIVEKPMALEASDAQAMIDAAAQAERTLAVCHNYLFIPAVVQARGLLAAGAIGRILGADIFWRMSTHSSDLRPNAMGWMAELNGGPFHEVLPHPVYLAEAVLGDLYPHALLVDDNSNPNEMRLQLTSASGPVQIAVSLAANPVRKNFRIYGDRGSIDIDLATNVAVLMHSRNDRLVDRALVNLSITRQIGVQTLKNGLLSVAGRLRHGHEGLLAAFYNSLQGGPPIPTDGKHGLSTINTLDCIWRLYGKDLQTDISRN